MLTQAFDELSKEDQHMAVDVAIACSILMARLPALSKNFFELLSAEFASTHNVPPNVARYALRQVGQMLFKEDWGFTVTKRDGHMITLFVPAKESVGNGSGSAN